MYEYMQTTIRNSLTKEKMERQNSIKTEQKWNGFYTVAAAAGINHYGEGIFFKILAHPVYKSEYYRNQKR